MYIEFSTSAVFRALLSIGFGTAESLDSKNRVLESFILSHSVTGTLTGISEALQTFRV